MCYHFYVINNLSLTKNFLRVAAGIPIIAANVSVVEKLQVSHQKKQYSTL
jgi:hypothetical protein